MNHELIVIQQLVTSIGEVDQVLADKITRIPNSEEMDMIQLANTANRLMRDRLQETASDAALVKRGCHPLTTPENWDAVSYWLSDISKQYVPALRQAKVNQYENSTCG